MSQAGNTNWVRHDLPGGLSVQEGDVCPDVAITRDELSSVGTGCLGRLERCTIPSGRDRKGLSWILKKDEGCSVAWSRGARNAYIRQAASAPLAKQKHRWVRKLQTDCPGSTLANDLTSLCLNPTPHRRVGEEDLFHRRVGLDGNRWVAFYKAHS